MAISLAVGSSTIAILQFFYAIADGVIDAAERGMMGVVYIVLRIAMVIILVTSLLLTIVGFQQYGAAYFSPEESFTWTVIAVVYLNAIAMTKHWIPSTWGPAIQASSWYSLGIMSALVAAGVNGFSYAQVFISYAVMFSIALGAINLTMFILKRRLRQQQTYGGAEPS